jgi:nucleotide-binding universal stress UspA family protein
MAVHPVLAYVDHANDPLPPVALARELAGALGAPLTLLTVAPPDADDAAVALARDRLDAMAGRARGARTGTRLRRGPEGPVVAETAEADRAGLVVVPWSGSGAPGHLLHDQIAQHLLHRACVPVLLVPTSRAHV